MRIVCPTCRKVTTWQENPHRPFCSEKCRLTDLGKWAAGDYRITVEDPNGSPKETDEREEVL